mgnify:CR=1 FL=1
MRYAKRDFSLFIRFGFLALLGMTTLKIALF